MKTIEYAYSSGISLQEARPLTEAERSHYAPEWQDKILIGLGNTIELPHIVWADLEPYRGREEYAFHGCGNRTYEITDAEWDALVALEAARTAAESANDRADKIAELRKLIDMAEAQTDIPTTEEAARRIRDYNNVNNEGGEGWVPTIISRDRYDRAKAELTELLKGEG